MAKGNLKANTPNPLVWEKTMGEKGSVCVRAHFFSQFKHLTITLLQTLKQIGKPVTAFINRTNVTTILANWQVLDNYGNVSPFKISV